MTSNYHRQHDGSYRPPSLSLNEAEEIGLNVGQPWCIQLMSVKGPLASLDQRNRNKVNTFIHSNCRCDVREMAPSLESAAGVGPLSRQTTLGGNQVFSHKQSITILQAIGTVDNG